MPVRRNLPLPDFRFLVEFGGTVQAVFHECSGLKTEIEVFEYQEGGENRYTHKLPGRRKFTNIVLKRGMTDSLDFWNWLNEVVAGNTKQRRNVSIILLDETHQSGMRWEVKRAFPVKWEGPAMKADGKAITVETLELAHYGFTMEPRSGGS
jgi:phage tail-like protein